MTFLSKFLSLFRRRPVTAVSAPANETFAHTCHQCRAKSPAVVFLPDPHPLKDTWLLAARVALESGWDWTVEENDLLGQPRLLCPRCKADWQCFIGELTNAMKGNQHE